VSQVNPMPAVPVLNYAGPVVPSRPAFNARRAWAWKGDHLFRVYLSTTHLYFVRIGGARNQGAALHGGLLGALIGMWLNSMAKKKEAKRVLEFEDKSMDELLAGHKRNHVIPVADVSDLAIESTGFWGGNRVRLAFRQVGEKKPVRCVLEGTSDVDAAIQQLPMLFPGLRISVQRKPGKDKYVKIPVR
jgi:hypothetical protein